MTELEAIKAIERAYDVAAAKTRRARVRAAEAKLKAEAEAEEKTEAAIAQLPEGAQGRVRVWAKAKYGEPA